MLEIQLPEIRRLGRVIGCWLNKQDDVWLVTIEYSEKDSKQFAVAYILNESVCAEILLASIVDENPIITVRVGRTIHERARPTGYKVWFGKVDVSIRDRYVSVTDQLKYQIVNPFVPK